MGSVGEARVLYYESEQSRLIRLLLVASGRFRLLQIGQKELEVIRGERAGLIDELRMNAKSIFMQHPRFVHGVNGKIPIKISPVKVGGVSNM